MIGHSHVPLNGVSPPFASVSSVLMSKLALKSTPKPQLCEYLGIIITRISPFLDLDKLPKLCDYHRVSMRLNTILGVAQTSVCQRSLVSRSRPRSFFVACDLNRFWCFFFSHFTFAMTLPPHSTPISLRFRHREGQHRLSDRWCSRQQCLQPDASHR